MAGLDGLSEAARQVALQRFRLLAPHLQDQVPLAPLARAAGVSLRTLQRWRQRYWQEGLAGLVRRRRADDGCRQVVAEETVQQIEGLALARPARSIASVHRQIAASLSAQGQPVPSYATVHAIVAALPEDLVTLAHEGTRAYTERYDLVLRREAQRPNHIWQADHTQLDVLVLREPRPPAKPWLTVILDDYSRAVAGFCLTFEAPTTLHTALALHQAIWRKTDPRWSVGGIPEVFYSDHGSDFTSHYLEQVLADLAVHQVFSQVGQPRGRGRIERFFETVGQLFAAELPGYAPPGDRVRGRPQLTLAQLDARLREFLLGVYHQRVHSETGVTPASRWSAGAFIPRWPESLEQLDLLLLTVALPRVVHPDGLHFQGLRYVAPMLAAYVAEKVVLRYDPRDLAEVRVFHGDRFLCRAICNELAAQTVSLLEIQRARRARRRELRGVLTDRRRNAAHAEPPPETVLPPPLAEPRLKRYEND